MAAEDTTNLTAAPDTAAAPAADTFDYGDTDNGVDAGADTATDDTTTAADDATLDTPEPSPKYKVKVSGEELEVDLDELLNGYSRNSDYTKKSQEVAEHRKAVEQERESLANQAKAQQENIQEYATLVAVNQRIQQFDKSVNWAQLNQEDPVTAQRLWIEYSQLKDAQNTVAGRINQKEQQRVREEQGKTLEKQQETAKQIKECFDVVARDIKGWSPTMAKDLTKTGIALGFSDEELTSVKDPRFVKLLHKAHIAEQLLKKQTAVANPPKPQAKPVPQVGAGSAPAGQRLEEMGMADYIKARRKQLR